MTSVVTLGFDEGWSDGDPGAGRIRFDAPSIVKARNLYINAVDSNGAILDQLVPTWTIGDVIVVERGEGRIVAWVIGPIRHGGSYWKIPITVRTVTGSFAAHDHVALTHYLNEADALAAREASPAVTVPAVVSEPPPLVVASSDDVDALRTENAALLALLRDLTQDKTPLLVMDQK